MQLSAPIFILKQQAKLLSRKEKIPLHRALNRIARRNGFRSWSLLAASATAKDPGATLWAQLRPGDLVLIASPRGQGKTLLSLELAIENMRRGNSAAFFTLYFTQADVAECIRRLNQDVRAFADSLLVDDSDEICASHITTRLASAPAKTLVIIDYLQLLDQDRRNPALMEQVQQLKRFAQMRQFIIICLSQVTRSYDPAKRACPDLSDVRLPNPLDLALFDRACFLNQGEIQVAASA